MALERSRILKQGETVHAHEREGITFVESQLPNNDPYHVWELVELVEPSSGRQYEIDMIVLGHSALYVLELKGGPGRYTGDSVDWHRIVPGERAHYMDPPLRLTNFKCKVLRGMLERHCKDKRLLPRVEPLVFLSHPDVQLALREDGMVGVTTRGTIRDALVFHQYPGASERLRGQRINAPQIRAVVEAMRAAGIRAQAGRDRVGSYELGAVLRDGALFQDRVATHTAIEGMKRRARIYLVPQQTSTERRVQLLRAAEREAKLVMEVRGNPHVLSCVDYVRDAPRGPTVMFDDFAHGEPLEPFLRANPTLTFDQRLEIVRQLASALSYCHKREIVHGAVSPDSVLARLTGDKPEIRLYNFQLARSELTSGTVHASDYGLDPTQVYQAPEVRLDPASKSAASDIFGLGALAYRILINAPPGRDVAEVEARLHADRALDPRHDAPDTDEELAEALKLATGYAIFERADDALEWLSLLEDAIEDRKARGPGISPLAAKSEDILDGDLLVHRVLGEGASSRVLLVDHDGKDYALKVSLNEEQDPRLRAEAKVLEHLEQHARIVRFHRERVIDGRVCLLLSVAGERTLQRELANEGSVSLEFAGRYGEDLLYALQHLEEKEVVHRDIKPANLGVGSTSKSTKHLTLFDFSLAEIPDTELGVGTAAYRDPFLAQRGRWDHAADQYSAAVVLHEMLTGVRPRWGSDSVPADDASATLTLASENFDPALRDQLVSFFTRALARDAQKRFITADAMRKAWERALEEPAGVQSVPPLAPAEDDEGDALRYDDAALEGLPLDASVEALPLSTRARNALDRAGVANAQQVLSLPDNRLSAIRGAGRKVQREIHDFREAYQRVRGAIAGAEPFFAAYRGEVFKLDHPTGALPPALVAALLDAGLPDLGAVASAPQDQVQAVCARAKADAKPLRDWLSREHKAVDAREKPKSIEDWLAALLPRQAKLREQLELLFGLRTPFLHQRDVTVAQVAAHLHVTPANLYTNLGKLREVWAQHGEMATLLDLVRTATTTAGGALSLLRAAEPLLKAYPARETSDGALALTQASALARIVGVVDAAAGGNLAYARVPGRVGFLVQESIDPRALQVLGTLADKLATREVPASPAEAARQLAAAVPENPLAALLPARLIELACDASRQAACSSRLEIYPRGMSAERAIVLSATVLTGELKPEALRQRVATRYPEAEPLPERPALDTLLASLKLSFDEATGVYRREGQGSPTNLATRGPSSLSLHQGGRTAHARREAASSREERDCIDQVQAALEADAFRVVGVDVPWQQQATSWLARHHGMRVRSFDALFFTALEQLTAQGKPSLQMVLEADALGTTGPRWAALHQVAQRAADQALRSLLPVSEPTVLTQLGLCHHFQLHGALERLVTQAQSSTSRALFLIVPGSESITPRIEGQLAIPGLLPGQILQLRGRWLRPAA